MRTVFTEVQALSGHAYTLDAAANDGVDNTLYTAAGCCSPSKSFFDIVHNGRIWATLCKLLSFVQHHVQCQKLAPSRASACMLSPFKHLLSGMRLLPGMRLMKTYRKGTT